jgi:hypothetical protein
VAYERNAKRLLAELDSRDAAAAMRVYADEIDTRAAELEARTRRRHAGGPSGSASMPNARTR